MSSKGSKKGKKKSKDVDIQGSPSRQLQPAQSQQIQGTQSMQLKVEDEDAPVVVSHLKVPMLPPPLFTVSVSKIPPDALPPEVQTYLEQWRQAAKTVCKAHMVNTVFMTAMNIAFYIVYLVEAEVPAYTFPPIKEGHGVHLKSILLDLFELWACIILFLSLNEDKVNSNPTGAMPTAVTWLLVAAQSVWLKWELIHEIEPHRTILSYFMACTTLDLAVFCGIILVYTLALHDQGKRISAKLPDAVPRPPTMPAPTGAKPQIEASSFSAASGGAKSNKNYSQV